MSRPRLPIDGDLVERLASIMCTNEEIAVACGCCKDTIVDRFSDRLEKGRAQGKQSLRRSQWELAKKGNPAMNIWLGKQWLGQRDTVEKPDERHDELRRFLDIMEGRK